MNKSTWQTLAIIFFIIAAAETSLLVFSYLEIVNEDKQYNECMYNICSDYPKADYEDNVCYCYDEDFYGDPILEYTEYMK